MNKFLIVIAATLLLVGCGAREPSGKAVELTQEDKDKVNWAYDEKELWAAWHTKGNRLFNDEKYDEALYCFNQALKAWPKKFDDGKNVHQAEPQDTLLQKGHVFLKMNEPKLALKYFQKVLSYRPGNSIAKSGIERAEAMMK